MTEKRRALPWVEVEKEYEFDAEDGKKTLGELFDGRSQLLAYSIMYGPDYLREGPSFIAFARENETVYHPYTVMAPDPFVAPYHSFLLERTPKPPAGGARAWRKDEYPDA